MSKSLIVIEGLDGAGKSTQLDRLHRRLSAERETRKLAFPDYNDPSSALVKMYLNGEFGQSPYDTSAYAASLLYAADRFASYRRHWKADYEREVTILTDRYTQANVVYQMPKLPREEWRSYIDWLYDLEYGKLGIPEPSLVVLFDLEPAISQQQLLHRYGGDASQRDIHERDAEYLRICREAALTAADYLHWQVLRCDDGTHIRSLQDISDELFAIVSASQR